MNPTKKIVLLTPGFPADENDAACTTYLQDLVLSYKEFYPDAKIEVIAFQYPFRKGDYRWNGINIYSAGGANSKYLSKLFTWKRVLKKLKRINVEGKIDIVHSFWLTECTFIGQIFCKKNNIKQVASILGQDVREYNSYLKRIDIGKIKIVAIAELLADRFFALKNKRVHTIIPFGIDKKKLIRKGNAERTIDIIGVGALTPLKNYSLFIDVVCALKKHFPEIKACIIGKGEEMEILSKKINSLGLQNNIVLKGELPHAEVFEMMCESKIFLHTSSYEGQSLVITEAMYAGSPVVCFDVVKPDKNEKILICNNEQMMIMTIRKLMKEKLDHRSVDVQTVEETAKRYFELYDPEFKR